MIEPKDKRTKEYKEWKKLKGAGDLVEKVLQVTKLDKVAKFILGEDCGCNERKEYLNRIMPFAKVECLIEDEYNWLHKYYNGKTSRIDSSTQDQFNVIYNRVFNKKVVRSTCSSCVAQRVKELRKVYDGYK
tara:strand:- start:205 stop:597 length:393 start_codon:yes stop_codon:yes gene_type:complete